MKEEIKIIDGRKVLIRERKDTGFVFEPEAPKDYVRKTSFNPDAPLGRMSAAPAMPVIFKDGHGWNDIINQFKPEMQFNSKFDSFSCTIFSSAKALCAYLLKVYGIKITISEMFNAFYAGVVSGRGTSVRQALESFRTKGWVEDKDYPFTAETTQQQYFSRPPMTIELKAKGVLTKWNVYWEAVGYSGNVPHSQIITSLQKAPVLCSGFAWASYYGEGVYYDYNNPANHLFCVSDWFNNPEYDLLANDSYPQDNQYDEDSAPEEFEKKLAKSFRIWSAHRIWLMPVKKDLSLILNLKNMLTTVIRDLRGGFWFIKDKKRQKINKYSLDIMTVLSREAGIKTVNDKELNNYQETTEFYPVVN